MVTWVKQNKVLALVVVLATLWCIKGLARGRYEVFPMMGTMGRATSSVSRDFAVAEMAAPAMDGSYGGADMAVGKMMVPPMPPVFGESSSISVEKRMVVTESSFSVLVKNVRDSLAQIDSKVASFGGFMVNTSVSDPGEASSGYITVRVPSDKVGELTEFLRSSSVRVTSEQISGTDVTDQYTDYQARLTTLEKTKAKFEEILDEAVEVGEIMQVQQSIIQIQDQIDSITGMMKQLENTTTTSRVSIYLSTDELALPYAPNDAWRPMVEFKQAVRSMVLHIRELGNLAIWLAVFSVFWIPALVLVAGGYWFFKRRK